MQPVKWKTKIRENKTLTRIKLKDTNRVKANRFNPYTNPQFELHWAVSFFPDG